MMEEIAVENGRISNFEGLMTLILDRVIMHTAVHHSSTSTYMPNVIEIELTNFLWLDTMTYMRIFVTHGRMDHAKFKVMRNKNYDTY